jgi:hypothetical protein
MIELTAGHKCDLATTYSYWCAPIMSQMDAARWPATPSRGANWKHWDLCTIGLKKLELWSYDCVRPEILLLEQKLSYEGRSGPQETSELAE